MLRVRYGVGMSLDGYIADARGGTDWLVSDAAYDAGTFVRAVDTAIMGRITYEVARRQGMRGGYPGLRTYVCSRTLRAAPLPCATPPAPDAPAAHPERGSAHRAARAGVCGADNGLQAWRRW